MFKVLCEMDMQWERYKQWYIFTVTVCSSLGLYVCVLYLDWLIVAVCMIYGRYLCCHHLVGIVRICTRPLCLYTVLLLLLSFTLIPSSFGMLYSSPSSSSSSPTIFTSCLFLVPPPACKLLLQRIFLVARRIHQLFQAVLPRSYAADGVVLNRLACLPEEFVRGVFFVGVEVDNVGDGGGAGGMIRFAGVVVAAEELAFGGGGEVEVGGYGV